MTEKLERCPFCGGPASIKIAAKKHKIAVWCECNFCSAKTQKYYPYVADRDVVFADIENSKNEAIAAWNSRA